MSNRLGDETSPYLLQHKDNPVDWYPWGEDALDRALREDKPILLSVGYAACHWCHVMEHESFEDPVTAAAMNESFVCVKVDREERPDIDTIYMEAVQTMTGSGGWPMTVFLTPEGVPFYGGTYFPPEDRHGLPSFRRLLEGISTAWRERRDELEEQGRHLTNHIGQASLIRASDDPISRELLEEALGSLRATFDSTYGGFGSAPKFPQPMSIDLLLRLAWRGWADAPSMAQRTLDAMCAGGMYDQLAGGFARYSVDQQWLVPHFEKMLYDNAQLIKTYARSWLATGTERHRSVAEATVGWLLGEMRDPDGGFWSSLDADSEGEEGRFYVWSLDEFREVAGTDAEQAIGYWGITGPGNFEGKNIPVYADDSADPSAIERARRRLLERRAERVRPGADTKVVTAWNAMAISALAESGVILGHDDWVETAVEAMRFVLSDLRVDGRLMRTYSSGSIGRSGVAKHLGYCEDYACVLEAALALFEATHEPEWLEEAKWAADEATRLFWDTDAGAFFTTGIDASMLITRPKDFVDNAVPAANSVMALELQRLALLTGEQEYEARALVCMQMVSSSAPKSPQGFGHLLSAIDFYASEPPEIVIVGEPRTIEVKTLVDVVRTQFIPNKVLVVAASHDDRMAKLIPLLEGRTSSTEATAYVCHRGHCNLPVTRPEELRRQLESA